MGDLEVTLFDNTSRSIHYFKSKLLVPILVIQLVIHSGPGLHSCILIWAIFCSIDNILLYTYYLSRAQTFRVTTRRQIHALHQIVDSGAFLSAAPSTHFHSPSTSRPPIPLNFAIRFETFRPPIQTLFYLTFIHKNHVVKLRLVCLRCCWTSFGVSFRATLG